MKGGKSPLKLKAQQKGYTIVEVMIVLAVSGFMFVIAANFINGKQAKSSFTAGSNEMTSKVQDVIEQVERGKYSDVKLKCTAGASTTLDITFESDPDKLNQGANPPCVFLGKFFHFSVGGAPTKYEVFSIAGKRGEVTLATAMATPIASGSTDLTVDATIPQSLDVTSVKVDGIPTYGFGFVQGLGTKDSNGTYISGTQTVSMVRSTALTSPNDTKTTAASKIQSAVLVPANQAVICMSDGTRYTTITVGSNNNRIIAQTKRVSSC